MQNPRLASRYAKSILDLAIEKDQLEKVYQDMLFLDQVVKSSREFNNMLDSPVIASDKKDKVISAITSGKISSMTDSFLKLLVVKNREINLQQIISSFINQYKQKKDIHTVILTTAVPLHEDVKNKIIEQVKKTSNMKNIELKTIIDPSIIGGFILQTGDKLVDASISYDLKEISREFENNDFIYKVR
ncbi:MAG TPA: ATP synthase F1 subunit delta [Flavisolibacter sp.]|nr:ATP synthase F1 subunit delta [Flavisolibacter sp.]